MRYLIIIPSLLFNNTASHLQESRHWNTHPLNIHNTYNKVLNSTLVESTCPLERGTVAAVNDQCIHSKLFTVGRDACMNDVGVPL